MGIDQQEYYRYLALQIEQVGSLEAERRVFDWREREFTPPESDLTSTREDLSSRKRKSRSQSLDSSMAASPVKRKRGQPVGGSGDLDSSSPFCTSSAVLSLQPRLATSNRSNYSGSTSSKRSPSPAGKLLNALRASKPAIDCRALDDDRPVPLSVTNLRKALAKDIGVGIIPTNLKVSRQSTIELVAQSGMTLLTATVL
jgi:hypothetical protein